MAVHVDPAKWANDPVVALAEVLAKHGENTQVAVPFYNKGVIETAVVEVEFRFNRLVEIYPPCVPGEPNDGCLIVIKSNEPGKTAHLKLPSRVGKLTRSLLVDRLLIETDPERGFVHVHRLNANRQAVVTSSFELKTLAEAAEGFSDDDLLTYLLDAAESVRRQMDVTPKPTPLA